MRDEDLDHEAVRQRVKALKREHASPVGGRAAAQALRKAESDLYEPMQEAVEGIRRGDPRCIEAAIVFLEIDPWVFRSGYQKRRLCDHLSRARLDEQQKERLASYLMNALQRGGRGEFPHMLRLAHHVRSAEFARSLERLAGVGSPGQREAANRMLQSVQGSRRSGRHGRRG